MLSLQKRDLSPTKGDLSDFLKGALFFLVNLFERDHLLRGGANWLVGRLFEEIVFEIEGKAFDLERILIFLGIRFSLEEIQFSLEEIRLLLEEIRFSLEEIWFSLEEIRFLLEIGFLFEEIRFLFEEIRFLFEEIRFLLEEIRFLLEEIRFLLEEIRFLLEEIRFLLEEIRFLLEEIWFFEVEKKGIEQGEKTSDLQLWPSLHLLLRYKATPLRNWDSFQKVCFLGDLWFHHRGKRKGHHY